MIETNCKYQKYYHFIDKFKQSDMNFYRDLIFSHICKQFFCLINFSQIWHRQILISQDQYFCFAKDKLKYFFTNIYLQQSIIVYNNKLSIMINIPIEKKKQCSDIQEDYQQHEQYQFPEEKFTKRIQKSNFVGLNTGAWSEEQNARFAAFIDINFDIFRNKTKRKNSKIFLAFSKLIHDRSPSQCRSHFQKKMNRFKTISAMINYYKSSLGCQKYTIILQALKKEWLKKNQQKQKSFNQSNGGYLKDSIKLQQQQQHTILLKLDEEYVYVKHKPEEIVQEFNGLKQYLKAFCFI